MSQQARVWIYRAVATAGGGLGVLPLLALARSLAMSLFEVPLLPGGQRLTRDVKEATYLEVAVLVVLVPAAAIFFGRILPAFLEERGFATVHAHLPGVGFAISL